MIFDWKEMIHHLELYAVLTLTSICLLYSFVVHMKMRGLMRRMLKQNADLEAYSSQAAGSMESLRQQMEEAARHIPAATTPGPQMNLIKRGQALRMRRRGETSETIAAALGVPRNEVDLLMKVQELAVVPASKRA
jgi:hypothetical protein